MNRVLIRQFDRHVTRGVGAEGSQCQTGNAMFLGAVIGGMVTWGLLSWATRGLV